MINYLILHLLFIVYALNTVLGRMAAPYGWTDWRRFALLAGQPVIHGRLFQNHLCAGGQKNGKQVQPNIKFFTHAPPPWKPK